jgi:hypothetical protein
MKESYFLLILGSESFSSKLHVKLTETNDFVENVIRT